MNCLGRAGSVVGRAQRTGMTQCIRRTLCSPADPSNYSDVVLNELGVQMLPDHLRKQIFTAPRATCNAQQLREIKLELLDHGLLQTTNIKPLPSVALSLPGLKGNDIAQHITEVAEEIHRPYAGLELQLSKCTLPAEPHRWSISSGWSMYNAESGEAVRVDFPHNDALVVDIKAHTFESGHVIRYAVAVSPDNWYSWISHQSSINDTLPDDLVNFDKVSGDFEFYLGSAKLLVVHDIARQRSSIREQFFLRYDSTKFLETRSMHIAVAGMCEEQRDFLHASKCPEHVRHVQSAKRHSWQDHTSLYDLADVYSHYCQALSKQLPLKPYDWSRYNTFDDSYIQHILAASARDVMATHSVFKELYSVYCERCPHPATRAGTLELSTPFLPTNPEHWSRFLKEANKAFESCAQEKQRMLVTAADEAVKLMHGERYKHDIWLWDLDWTPVYLDLDSQSMIEEFIAKGFYCQGTAVKMPSWYVKLCPTVVESRLYPDRTRGIPCKFNEIMQVKLLRLQWRGLPLHKVNRDRKQNNNKTNAEGWGYLIPWDEDMSYLEQGLPSSQYSRENLSRKSMLNFPLEKFREYCEENGCIVDEAMINAGIRGDLVVPVGIPGVLLHRLPVDPNDHGKKWDNPVFKELFQRTYTNSSALGSQSKADLLLLRKASKRCFWNSNSKFFTEQLCVPLSRDIGAIVPDIHPVGTYQRKPLGKILFSHSGDDDVTGSEVRAMFRAPPGYVFVGADVDTQELWILNLIADSYRGGVHGCTPLSFMALQGNKCDGTDFHSRTATDLGCSRENAKALNYRILYGGGQNSVCDTLSHFESHVKLSRAECEIVSAELIKTIKGTRKKGLWKGGTASHMVTRTRELATHDQLETPVLRAKMSKAMLLEHTNFKDYHMKRVNWISSSSAVDFAHIFLLSMKWLCQQYDIDARYCISFHDSFKYLVTNEDRYRAALALQMAHLYTRAMFAHELGIDDLPLNTAFFSQVEIDTCLRKNPKRDYVTPSNPGGLERTYGIRPGETLSIYDIIEKTGDSLVKYHADGRNHDVVARNVMPTNAYVIGSAEIIASV